MPIRCTRCYTTFPTETALEGHSRQVEPCQIRPGLDRPEGFNKDQEKRLKNRRGVAGKSEEEKWIAIFRILFPDDLENTIPSPCK